MIHTIETYDAYDLMLTQGVILATPDLCVLAECRDDGVEIVTSETIAQLTQQQFEELYANQEWQFLAHQ